MMATPAQNKHTSFKIVDSVGVITLDSPNAKVRVAKNTKTKRYTHLN